MTISLYDSESKMKKKVVNVTEEPKVTCIQCSKSKALRHYKILRGKRRDVCDNCAGKNAREVQTAKLRRECCPKGKMNMCGDVTLITGDLKWCGACDTVHHIGEFKKGQKYKDGHASKCSTCVDSKISIMSKAVLVQFRNEKSKVLYNLKETVNKVINNVPSDHSSLSGVAESMDILDAIDDVREMAVEVKEAVVEVKGWWAKIKAKWNEWFK
jgi:hypothetical protein